jgi:Electron transfer DM13
MPRARILVALACLAAVGAVGLALFQPWKLWVDERVDTAPPVGATPLLASPAFVSLDHPTSGTVQLLVDTTGRRFVRLLDLATDNGPDLKVYLSANPVDGPEGSFDDDFVDLGRLQANLGNQNYEIPAEVDLSRFRSIVIWCDRFNSAFGAAALTA